MGTEGSAILHSFLNSTWESSKASLFKGQKREEQVIKANEEKELANDEREGKEASNFDS